jgi:hypothetical protein
MRMPNCLTLAGDGDEIDLIVDIERLFDVTFRNDEAETVQTVGDLYDLLLRKLPPNDADRKCASAMTFYRLRRALREMGYAARLTPASPIALLEEHSARRAFKALEERSGLQLPALRLTAFGAVGCAIAWGAIAAIIVWSAVKGLDWITAAGGLAGAIPVGVAIARFDPQRLPRDMQTLADLVRQTAPLNFGRLAKHGARHSDGDVWDAMVTVLSEYGPKDAIARDTFFLDAQLKAHMAQRGRDAA